MAMTCYAEITGGSAMDIARGRKPAGGQARKQDRGIQRADGARASDPVQRWLYDTLLLHERRQDVAARRVVVREEQEGLVERRDVHCGGARVGLSAAAVLSMSSRAATGILRVRSAQSCGMNQMPCTYLQQCDGQASQSALKRAKMQSGVKNAASVL